MNTTTIGTGIIALIIGIGIGYFGGNALHPAAAPSARGSFAGTGGSGFAGARGGAAGGGFLSGTVSAADSGSITLNTRDGSSHVVLVTPATTVSKSVSGALSDVSVGSNVLITGTTNSDGSVTAAVIQLRPATPAAAPTPQ
ncbi:MAG: hypothetical protein WAN50_01780 [Minisyncoccia bacterium]